MAQPLNVDVKIFSQPAAPGPNQSAKNVYVQQVTLNGQKLTQPFLTQQDVAKGGVLVFVMGARPARK